MSERDDRKNRFLAAITSVGIHLGILALFLFVMGWTAPDPPLSELGSGVELNLGLDTEGSGDIQPEVPTSASQNQAEAKAEEQQQKDKPEEMKAEAKAEESKRANENLSSTEESPVTVKEIKKEEKKPESDAEKIAEVKPKDKTAVDSKKESKKEIKDAVTTKAGSEKPKSASGVSQGDDKNKAGDKGSPEGSLDPNAQYTGKAGKGGPGSGGGGNGFALNMAGWNWDVQPDKPKLPDNENGRIVFEIEVDDEGQITKITTITRGLSPEAESICKQEIQKRSLIRNAPGAVPEKSIGRITFVLHTQ
jgi:protein TonB